VNKDSACPISYCAVRLFSTSLALSFVVLLFVSAADASVAVAPNSPEPCNISAEDAAGLTGDAAIDVHATSDYSDAARRLVMEGEFDQLDCLANGLRSRKEKFSGGMWKIHILYMGLSDPQPENVHSTESDWQRLLANLQRWVNTKPNSVTARIALAWAYTDYAWAARGNGYSNTVSDSGWQQFDERMAKARQILDEADALPTKCPEWFVAMLDVAQTQGWGVDEIRALYQKALAFEPDYYYYERAFANLLLPQWFGEEGDVERFAEQAADQIGGDRGDALYFQIATKVICGCSKQPKMSCPRIVKGSEALEKLDGPSMLNLNLVAKMGAYTSDLDAVDAASVAFTRIGDQWDEETWKTHEQFNYVKKSITDYGPQAAKELEQNRVAEANAKTPEGSRYAIAFANTYRQLVEQCTNEIGNNFKSLQTLTSAGLGGTITDMSVVSDGPINVCVFQKLQAFRQQKKAVFPSPPRTPYWVRLDFTKADFDPVAAK
jgi:hypothetical protein